MVSQGVRVANCCPLSHPWFALWGRQVLAEGKEAQVFTGAGKRRAKSGLHPRWLNVDQSAKPESEAGVGLGCLLRTVGNTGNGWQTRTCQVLGPQLGNSSLTKCWRLPIADEQVGPLWETQG